MGSIETRANDSERFARERAAYEGEYLNWYRLLNPRNRFLADIQVNVADEPLPKVFIKEGVLLLNQNTSQLCCGDEWLDKNLSRLRDTPLLAAGRVSLTEDEYDGLLLDEQKPRILNGLYLDGNGIVSNGYEEDVVKLDELKFPINVITRRFVSRCGDSTSYIF